MKRMKKLIAAASAAVMLVSANIVPVSAANSTRYIFIKGDVNNDGAVNFKDYYDLNRYYCGFDVPGVTNISADVNKDGQITHTDVEYLYKIFRSGNNTQVMFMENSKNNYTLVYGNETFEVYYKEIKKTDGSIDEDWQIRDSWRIKNLDDMKYICQIIKDEHPIHYLKSSKVRNVDSMVYEWVAHNLKYDQALKDGDAETAYRCQHVDINSNDANKYDFFN